MQTELTRQSRSVSHLITNPLRGIVLSSVPGSIDELPGLIADLERDGKGLPVLLKQYLKAGGRVLRFNLDRGFSHVVDALVMVDLRVAPVSLMECYLGKADAQAFAATAERD